MRSAPTPCSHTWSLNCGETVATKAELEGLPGELARRIYDRWKDWLHSHAALTAGIYDGVLQSDADARALVNVLSDDLIEGLAFGPMPEPRCGVCMVLNRNKLLETQTTVAALLDYHDTSYRDGSEPVWRRGGAEAYRRCLVIYNEARAIRGETPVA